MTHQHFAKQNTLELPPFAVETPCFIILEDAVRHNLRETIAAAGGPERLVPHVKTHRSPWLTKMLVDSGVTAFKTATPLEVQMVLESGAQEVVWSYPTMSDAAIKRVVGLAQKFRDAKVTGLVDSLAGLELWTSILATQDAPNVGLRVDLDPGMGRTGIDMTDAALTLATAIHDQDRLDGWHLYDGHIQDPDLSIRTKRFQQVKERMDALSNQAREQGLTDDLIAGGSYSFALWAEHSKARVSPGSWTYSSSQHQAELADRNWTVAAYVLSTVLSERNNTVTLDAGSKAISPDQPMTNRFSGVDEIIGMKEEHTIVVSSDATPGDQIALVPRHACTTAYLYKQALVKTSQGTWEVRPQLGCER